MVVRRTDRRIRQTTAGTPRIRWLRPSSLRRLVRPIAFRRKAMAGIPHFRYVNLM
jgi:hypothetical protein